MNRILAALLLFLAAAAHSAGVAPVNPTMTFVSATGAPLATGSVQVYLAGTVTPTNTWSDRALSSLNTNPVVLDASGRATIWLDPAVTYKFQVSNSLGAVQYTVDNVAGVVPVIDGDKGDVTVSAGGTVWSVDNGAITLAKQANLAANSIIGNNTGAPATPLALTATQVATMLETATTFTPTLTFSTPGNLAVSYSSRQGSYIKIGRQLILTVRIITSAFTHTTASGDMRITGIPNITPNAAPIPVGKCVWGGITKAGYTEVTAEVSNGDILNFWGSGSGVAPSYVTAADMPTGGSVVLHCTITRTAVS